MRKMRIRNDRRGFTLVELVIIIVILGLIGAVAIPKYYNMVTKAKESAAKGALGGMRSAISIFYANAALNDPEGVPAWPTLAELQTVGTVMAQSMPKNPYQAVDAAPDSIVTGVTKGTLVGVRGGWAYLEATGDIWLNTNTAGENDW